MMPYLTIVISWEYESYRGPDDLGRSYWANRLGQVHQIKMNQGREHAEAIVDVRNEYRQHRNNPQYA